MLQARTNLVASAARPLRLRVRPDLRFIRQHYQGRCCWAVKDPLALKYFRFEEEELDLLRMFDGRTSLEAIRDRFESRFAPQRISSGELQQFAARAYRNRLLIADVPGQGEMLLDRRRRERRRRMARVLTNPLAVRVPLFDPDRLLARLSRVAGWWFTWPAALFGLALALLAVSLVLVQFDEFQTRLPAFHQFFGPSNWVWLAATLAVTKVLHEFGHGLACKRFGGECHEMGLMLLVLTPCLYCNVTDSWMLPDKWRRIAIGGAGMYVEAVLAAICTFVWWWTHPGLLHYLCLNVMFVCSVSTLAFNANPLLRYDGYYMLSDWLEVPNLRRKSAAVVRRFVTNWILRWSPRPDRFVPHRHRGWFATYAVAAFAYRWMVTISILLFLNHVFEPYGFQVVGRMIVVLVAIGMVVRPMIQGIRFLRTPGMMRRIHVQRATTSGLAALVVLAGLLLVPLPYRVHCVVRIQTREAATVYVDVPGRLSAIHTQPGKLVERGQLLVTLENVELRRLVEDLRTERARIDVRLAGLRQRSFRDAAALAEMESLQQAAAILQVQLEKRQADLARLEMTAPATGVVVAARRRPATDNDERLPNWSDQPLDRRNLNASLREGVIVCQIAEPGKLEAVLAIDQTEIEFVRAGQTVDVYLNQMPTRKVRTAVEHVAKQDLRFAPLEISAAGGAGLATVSDSQGRARPASTTYEASCPLDDASEQILVGATGQAKIHAGRQTLARRGWRYLVKTFRFDL